MKTSFMVKLCLVVLCMVISIELYLWGTLMLLLYPYQVAIGQAWGLLLVTTFLLVTLDCIIYEFRFLKRLYVNPNASITGAKTAFWLGVTPLILLAGLMVCATH